MLDQGLRKGSVRAALFKHFDQQRRRLTIFAKEQKVREMPLPDSALWKDLEGQTLEA